MICSLQIHCSWVWMKHVFSALVYLQVLTLVSVPVLGRGSFVLFMTSHLALRFKVHIWTGKASRNCMKFSLWRICASCLGGWDCACCELRSADTVCHSSPASGSHQSISFLCGTFWSPEKGKTFSNHIFPFHFPFDLYQCKRRCPGGEFCVGSRRMAALTYLGAWPDFWLRHEISVSTFFF